MILFSCAAKYVVDGVITAEDEYDRKSIDVSSKQLTDVTKGSKRYANIFSSAVTFLHLPV